MRVKTMVMHTIQHTPQRIFRISHMNPVAEHVAHDPDDGRGQGRHAHRSHEAEGHREAQHAGLVRRERCFGARAGPDRIGRRTACFSRPEVTPEVPAG